MSGRRRTRMLLLGVDIGGTDVKLGLVSRTGRLLRSGAIPTEPERPPHRMMRRLGEVVRGWLEEEGGSIRAVGVASAGLADPEAGILRASPNLPGLVGRPLARLVEKELGAAVAFDNDVNAAAYGEYRKGAGRGARAFLCVTVGTGVGGGLVLGGRLYRGTSNFAGEIGHVTIDRAGPLCRCGNHGCVESYIGVAPIVRNARALLQASGTESPLYRLAEGKAARISPKLVGEAARAGDAGARRLLEEAGEALGAGLGSVVNLLNLDRIAVGGGIALAGDALFRGIERGCRRYSFEASFQDVSIVPAQLETHASVIGSALLAARFAPPHAL